MRLACAAVLAASLGTGAVAADEVKTGGSAAWYLARYPQRAPGLAGLQGEGDVSGRLTWQGSGEALIHAEARARWTGGDLDQARLRQGYLELNPGQARIRIGRQVFDWSVVDSASPSDVLGGKDFSDLIRWERKGADAVSVRVGEEMWVEGALARMPLAMLPAEKRGWRSPVPAGIGFSQESPSNGWGRALRAGLTAEGFDLFATAYRGDSALPTAVAVGPTTLVARQERESAMALGLATSLGSWSTRLEWGRVKRRLGDDLENFALGADREWSDALEGGDSLWWLLQYNAERTLENRLPEVFDRLELRRALGNSWVSKLRYKWGGGSRWSLRLEGNFDGGHDSRYLSPALEWAGDQLSVMVGYDHLHGAADSFLAPWHDHSRAWASTVFRW